MAHITLSIPDEVYHEMKQHPEIKWSEIARKSIIEKTVIMKKKIPGKELLNILPKEVQESINVADKKESIKYAKKMREKDWKRMKY